MATVLRSILPASSARTEGVDDDYNVDYSFAIEYNGPPVSRDIPQVVPIDVRRIPTASIASSAVAVKNFSLPIIQPIVKSDQSSKRYSGELDSDSGGHFSNLGCSVRVYSRKSENGAQNSTSSGTSGFFDCRADSASLDDESKSGVLHRDVEDLDDESNSYFSCTKSRPRELSSEISSSDDRVADESSNRGNRTSVVTFRDMPSSDDESDFNEGPEMYPERPVVPNDGKKGLCYRCGKTNRFSEKEFCIVCGAKYCRKCVFRAMGCMPQGRKCITCIGYRIDESKRGSLGKCSRMLKELLNDDVMKRIMSAEVSCEVNQLPPHLIYVNGKPLSIEELVSLQSCPNPPKKLKPGKYWYDKVSGFWGKDGEKPSQIISPQLALGYQIMQGASNGDTNVVINNREITKPELRMLKAAGINCEGNPHFWVTADGSCQHEGMKNVLGNLWERKRVKLLCAALRLPYPPSRTSNSGGGDVDNDSDKVIKNMPEHKMMNKILLVGCDQSGTSTIFKQAKTVYGVPFSVDEKQNIKFVIQRNVYHYLCILLEGHARFEEEFLIEMRRQRAEEPGPSDYSEQVDESNIYSFTPRLKAFSDWLLQVMISGNLEVIFPAATREYSPLVEELWKDKAFQATYKRRNELNALPRVANYFLDRAVEISRIDYEPSDLDILYAEGITSSNGVASMEFYFPEPSRDGYMESSDDNGPPICYQLIRVHANSLGENCKWLTMFEDVDLVVYCVSLTDYDEYHEDINGVRTNKMLAAKKLFESIVTHQTLAHKEFLLVLNKFDLLEEMIDRVPLSQCIWFEDFNPVMSHHPHSGSSSNNNTPLAQRAFHYIAVKFKRLFKALTERKLFVSRATGLEPDSVDRALKYCREILKWSDEIQTVSMNEWSSESMEPSTSV
ncbi:extra-large guanine nucleotide-binding protein 1 [Phtheirospermum japonicum]|uniref:Extra-large guanine nucleotide-binding protein 1 n=1 Tax=Phtheirospermum japonicum TaxID=374723 RepID=A0A830BH09_9LAMI|nr:extra-large guanine nucleotide-binding protein 1 [Phtheirospermum japonicum]